MTVLLHIQKVLQNPLAMLGQDAFRMKLHADDRICLVFQSHHLSLTRKCRHAQLIRQWFLDDQRMIARRLERAGHAVKQAVAFVVDVGCFAMHQALRAVDHTAKHSAHALMTQTDTQRRRRWPKFSNDGIGNATVIRITRPGLMQMCGFSARISSSVT